MSSEKFGSRPDESLEVNERISTFRAEASKRFQELLNSSHKSLSEIAELLDAKEFLSITPATRSQAEARSFNVASYLDREITAQTFILPPEQFTSLEETVLPPDEAEIVTGSGTGFEQKEIIPRSRAMVEVLSELKLPYSVIEGQNDPGMMRTLSYKAFLLPTVHKIALVNDEEGNATFLVYDIKDPINEWQVYINQTKDQLKDLPEGKVATLIYPGDLGEWKIKVQELITSPGSSFIGKEKLIEKRELAPPGWLTIHGLTAEIKAKTGVGFGETIKNIADRYLVSQPQWFAFFVLRGSPASLRQHCAPELCDLIREKIMNRELAPPGWITATDLSTEFKKETQVTHALAVIKVAAQEYETVIPNGHKKYYTQSGREYEYYSPELSNALRERFLQREYALPGWMTRYMLGAEIRKNTQVNSDTAIQSIAASYKITNPGWFRDFYISAASKEKDEHLAPELCSIIREKIAKREFALSGWMTNKALAAEIDATAGFDSFSEVKIFAEKFKSTNPDWFKWYTNAQGGIYLHYSPEMCDIIRSEFAKKDSSALPEWMTNRSIVDEIFRNTGVNRRHTIEKFAREFLTIHPEWSRHFRDKKGKVRNHYSPELCHLIREKFIEKR